MRREYPERPIVAVGAVVLRGDDLLLAQRGKQPGYGTWSIPGGAVKVGESMRAAAAREVKEECGIDIEVGDVADVIDRVIVDEEGRVQYHYVIVDFVAVPLQDTLRPGSDCLAARWVRPTELDDYQLTSAAKDVIAKARRLLANHPLPSKTGAGDEPARSRAQ